MCSSQCVGCDSIRHQPLHRHPIDRYARERVGVGIDRMLADSSALEQDIRIIDANATELVTRVPQLADILLPRLLGRSLPNELRKFFWGKTLAYDKSVISHKVRCRAVVL